MMTMMVMVQVGDIENDADDVGDFDDDVDDDEGNDDNDFISWWWQ